MQAGPRHFEDVIGSDMHTVRHDCTYFKSLTCSSWRSFLDCGGIHGSQIGIARSQFGVSLRAMPSYRLGAVASILTNIAHSFSLAEQLLLSLIGLAVAPMSVDIPIV
jgi:hypothetical protein